MEKTLARIAGIVNGDIQGDGAKIIRGVAPFEEAASDEITFAGARKFLKKIEETGAGAVLVPGDFQETGKNIIRIDNPQVAFIKVIDLFHPPFKPDPGVNPSSVIGENLIRGIDISIAAHVVIGNNVTLGDRVIIHPGVVVGDSVNVGDDVEIYPNVTIREQCKIGSRSIIHAGTVIGSDGFGFAPDGEKYRKIPHIGIVQIDDDVEIGAVNTIDRAKFGKTWIKEGVKTDNLIHIAHNVTIGENTVIAAQVGISGSASIGKHVTIAGKAGFAGHLTIGDNTIIGPKASIYSSVSSNQIISGEQMPHSLWRRVQRILHRLPELKKKISEIEKKLNGLIEKNEK
jgi:UDP-3-O-[3-hydroxymyristoyl] glucosamine N-acyltransferase